MKRLLTILTIILSLAGHGQLQSFVVRSGGGQDTLFAFNPSTGDYVQLTKLPWSAITNKPTVLAATDTAAMLANYKAGIISAGVKIGPSDTAAMLSNYLTGLIATAQKVKYSDTASMLSAYLSNLIAKVKYSDTATMLSNYKAGIITGAAKIGPADTASMLANYKTGLVAIPTKVAFTDTAGMLANYKTGVIGSAKYTDTAGMLANYKTAMIAQVLRVLYTDTAAMLANYKTGLVSLTTKVNVSDTANMLANYKAGLVSLTLKAPLASPTFSGTVTLGTALAIASGGTNNGSLSVTQGSIYYGDGTKLVALAPGTSGQVLQTQGAAANPQWFTVTGTGDMILNGSQNVTGNKTFSAGTLISAANSATNAAHVFTPSGASLKTTSASGDLEVDAGGIPYYSHAASERGAIDAEQFVALTSANTLTSQTAVQPIFDGGGGPANGALTVASSKSYYFECNFTLSSLSASSGSFGFAFGGTATFTSQAWHTSAIKASTLTTAGTMQYTFNTAANTTIVTANTSTGGIVRVWGIVRINAGGTLIPQVSLGVAAAGVVGANSYFRIWPVGTNTAVQIGNWN